MRSVRLRLLVSLLAILVLLPVSAPRAVLAERSEAPELLTAHDDHGMMPRTDGTYLVLQDIGDIYGFWIDSDKDPFDVATGPAEQTQPDIDNGIVVWAERSGPDAKFSIQGKNLKTGDTFTVTNDVAVDEVYPAISGNRVAWISQELTGYKLMVRDIGTMASPLTVVSYGLNQRLITRPAIDGDWVVWARAEYVGEFVQGFGLFATRIGSGQIQTLGGAPWVHQIHPSYDVGDGMALYVLGGGVFARNLATQQETMLWGRHAPGAVSVTSDGRYVFFEERSLVPAYGEVVMRGYDLQTHSLFIAIEDTGTNILPHTGGGYLVWQEKEDSGYGTWISAVHNVLPSASFENPGTTNPVWLYFKETGHYLSYGFKDFWVRSGGLPVFGYPMTTEYDEFNRDLGEYRTAQYTERQRFEYHPAYAGTPYETSLGRLGAEDARRRGLNEYQAFARVSEPTSAGVEYFSATGHTLRGRFRDYWHNHGLDFGDRGISYRESLALFGYPISEEFADPVTGLRTQYFERAVFEYHPDNPDPYKVLLRRLGAEEIKRRDW
jgi:hypothetical protein